MTKLTPPGCLSKYFETSYTKLWMITQQSSGVQWRTTSSKEYVRSSGMREEMEGTGLDILERHDGTASRANQLTVCCTPFCDTCSKVPSHGFFCVLRTRCESLPLKSIALSLRIGCERWHRLPAYPTACPKRSPPTFFNTNTILLTGTFLSNATLNILDTSMARPEVHVA